MASACRTIKSDESEEGDKSAPTGDASSRQPSPSPSPSATSHTSSASVGEFATMQITVHPPSISGPSGAVSPNRPSHLTVDSISVQSIHPFPVESDSTDQQHLRHDCDTDTSEPASSEDEEEEEDERIERERRMLAHLGVVDPQPSRSISHSRVSSQIPSHTEELSPPSIHVDTPDLTVGFMSPTPQPITD